MLAVGFKEATGNFFDREKVVRAMGRAKRKALSKAGAFVRTRARSSIRKRKASAAPGSPPSDHGGALKRLLFFAWDESAEAVVIGPVLFPTRRSGSQSMPAPEALEEGGVVTATTKKGKQLVMSYHAFPYMGPALMAEAAAGTIPEQFRGSLGE